MVEPDLSLGHALTIERFLKLYEAGALSLALSPQFSIEEPEFVARRLNPRSREYAEQVMTTWTALTGRLSYDPLIDESFDLDLDEFIARPFPFSSRDPEEVGRYLAAVGWFLMTLSPEPSSRIVEFGAGWGHLASALAMTGYDVTAVDLNAASVEVLRTRNARLGVGLKVEQCGFLDFTATDLDMVIFFEAFHHCAEPLELLDRCTAMLKPGGRLVFLAEAIYDDFYCPWGVRLDGAATYMARHVGWLELGFNRSFMYRELNARGFSISEHRLEVLGPYGCLDVARLEPDGSTFGGTLPPDEACTWDSRAPLLAPARLATEHAAVTLCEAETFTTSQVSLSNLCDESLRVALDIGPSEEVVELDPGERASVELSLPRGNRTLRVTSDLAPSASLGLDRTGICVESISLS